MTRDIVLTIEESDWLQEALEQGYTTDGAVYTLYPELYGRRWHFVNAGRIRVIDITEAQPE